MTKSTSEYSIASAISHWVMVGSALIRYDFVISSAIAALLMPTGEPLVCEPNGTPTSASALARSSSDDGGGGLHLVMDIRTLSGSGRMRISSMHDFVSSALIIPNRTIVNGPLQVFRLSHFE